MRRLVRLGLVTLFAMSVAGAAQLPLVQSPDWSVFPLPYPGPDYPVPWPGPVNPGQGTDPLGSWPSCWLQPDRPCAPVGMPGPENGTKLGLPLA